MKLLLQLAPLAEAPADIAWLGEHECARLAEISDADRAAQYLAGHCLARQLAAELAGGSAPEWRLVVASDGRRRLEHPQLAALFTSISHVGTSLAVAVGRDALGLDLEAPGRERDWLGLARTMFSPAEMQVVSAAAQADREAVFLTFWTLKEAWAKRSGRGLQRQAARRCAAAACAGADAEAWTWRLPGGGSLALAASAGATVSTRGVPGEACPWHYLEPTT